MSLHGLACFLLALIGPVPARAAPLGVDALLEANAAATAGRAWAHTSSLALEYAYAGQGLTGTTSSLEDLRHGAFVDRWSIGPRSGALGFDGARVWEKEHSGTVSDQGGGDVLPLAINESYRNRNLWWRHDRGGALIMARGDRTDGDSRYQVLTVTPLGGKAFEAWFDAGSHLLARTVEPQGALEVTTFYSDYRAVDGVRIARKIVVDDGTGPSNRGTSHLREARFEPVQPVSAYAAPREHLDDFSLVNGAHETSVPFELVNNHIYAPVSINGGKPLRFIFDTGGHDILLPPTAAALGLRTEGSETATGAGEGVEQSGLTHVDSIRIGEAVLRNQGMSVLQFSAPGVEGVGESGMIGYELFARFVTRIDYGARRLTLIEPRFFDPATAGTPVPFTLYHQLPEVRGEYDGIPARFAIDTGARTPLTLTRAFVQRNRLPSGPGVEAVVGWGVGGATRGFVERGGVLTLGDVTVTRPLTILGTDRHGSAGLSDAFPNTVGSGLLKRFVITLDYAHRTLYLKPVQGASADIDSYDRAGLWVNETARGFLVADVTAHSPAAAAGLHKDDLITAVNDRPAREIRLYELRERLRTQAPGTTVLFTVQRGASTTRVRLTLAELV